MITTHNHSNSDSWLWDCRFSVNLWERAVRLHHSLEVLFQVLISPCVLEQVAALKNQQADFLSIICVQVLIFDTENNIFSRNRYTNSSLDTVKCHNTWSKPQCNLVGLVTQKIGILHNRHFLFMSQLMPWTHMTVEWGSFHLHHR